MAGIVISLPIGKSLIAIATYDEGSIDEKTDAQPDNTPRHPFRRLRHAALALVTAVPTETVSTHCRRDQHVLANLGPRGRRAIRTAPIGLQ